MAELRIERLWPVDLDSSAYRELVSAYWGAHAWAAHRRYYRWLFEQNPAAVPGQPLPIYVVRDEERFIGHRGLVPAEVVVDGQRLRARWGVDLFIHPAHQRKQIGTCLVNAVRNDFAIDLSLGQSPAGYAFAAKNGYRDTGALLRYTRLLHPLRCATKRAMAKVGLGTTARSLLGFLSVRRVRASYDIRVDRVTSFVDGGDERRDLRGARPTRAGICRTLAFMQWRYLDHPFVTAVRTRPLRGRICGVARDG